MRALIVSLILCLLTHVGFSQVILKIDNGFNTYSVKGEAVNLWEGKAYSYSGLLGVDYGHLFGNIITFSSQVGYIRQGGKESFISPESERHVEDWSYLHLNSTVRLQTREKTSLYIGVGPYANVRMGDGKFKRAIQYQSFDVDKVNYGVKTEIGFNHSFGECLQVGLNYTLLLPATAIIHTGYVHDKLRSSGVYVSVGYRLR